MIPTTTSEGSKSSGNARPSVQAALAWVGLWRLPALRLPSVQDRVNRARHVTDVVEIRDEFGELLQR
jgi:hypothetical protein